MKTEIETYRDMSEVDDATLDSIVAHESETLGSEDYGEYRFCSNPDCRRMLSAEEVYDIKKEDYVPLEQLEADGSDEYECPDCNGTTLRFFDKRVIKPILYADMYRGAIGSLLRDGKGAVKGACILKPSNLRDCFDNLNYRETLDWEKFRKQAAEVLSIEDKEDTPAIITNRVTINRPYRAGGMFIKLLAANGENTTPEHSKLPAFALVKYGGNALPILEAIGYKRITEDEYDSVVIGANRFGDIKRAFCLPLEEFGMEFGPQIKAATMAVRDKRATSRKLTHYRGVTLLDEIQSAVENLQPEHFNK